MLNANAAQLRSLVFDSHLDENIYHVWAKSHVLCDLLESAGPLDSDRAECAHVLASDLLTLGLELRAHHSRLCKAMKGVKSTVSEAAE